MHRSAQNYEGIALARVAPKVRRDALALDAEEDVAVRRCSTQHGGGDFEDAEDGRFADEMQADIDRHSCPLKPVDTLTEAEWNNAWQFTRKRTLKFVKDMFECGLLRDISASAQLRFEKPRWASAMRASLRKKGVQC